MKTIVTIPGTSQKITLDLGVELRQRQDRQPDGTIKESLILVNIYQL